MEGYSSLAKEANHLWLVGAFCSRWFKSFPLRYFTTGTIIVSVFFFDLKIVPTRCHIEWFLLSHWQLSVSKVTICLNYFERDTLFSLKVSLQYIFFTSLCKRFLFWNEREVIMEAVKAIFSKLFEFLPRAIINLFI